MANYNISTDYEKESSDDRSFRDKLESGIDAASAWLNN